MKWVLLSIACLMHLSSLDLSAAGAQSTILHSAKDQAVQVGSGAMYYAHRFSGPGIKDGSRTGFF